MSEAAPPIVLLDGWEARIPSRAEKTAAGLCSGRSAAQGTEANGIIVTLLRSGFGPAGLANVNEPRALTARNKLASIRVIKTPLARTRAHNPHTSGAEI